MCKLKISIYKIVHYINMNCIINHNNYNSKNHYKFMTSRIPAFLNPLTATSGLFSNSCHPEIIQLALGILITCNPTSTVTWESRIVSSYFFTSWAYHCWNLPLRWSFIGLLTEISKGCSLSVQFAGNWMGIML